MKPSLTVGLVPRIATRLVATRNLPEHQKWKASVLPCQSKKPPALNMRGRLSKCSRSLIQPFSSFLRGAIRFKSPRFSFQNSKNSLSDGTLRLSSPLSMIGAVLNTLNRTQCFFYRSVAGLPKGLAVNLERWQTGTNRWSMIQSAQRIENYHYAIRHLAGAAEALTRAGREVIYLDIGDPSDLWLSPSWTHRRTSHPCPQE